MKYLIIICIILNLNSCQTAKDNCCGENDIIISDIYSIEYDKKSRFISVDRLPGQHIQSKYIYAIQHHTYKYEGNIIEIVFYHDIINDNDYLDTNAIRKIDVDFGIIQIGIKNDESRKESITSDIIDAINNIRVSHYNNVDICYQNSKTENLIPRELENIGVINYERTTKRKIITVKLVNNSIHSMIDILYGNTELIYKYLDDKDLVRFEANGSSNIILRSFILTNSIGYGRDPNEWCGMGPKIKGFDCIYINNYDL